MFFRSFAFAAALLSMAQAQAVDVQVVYVGQNPANNVTGLKYWPENIKAEPGTMVQFQFWTGNHTITQSSFDKPCTPWTPAANESSTQMEAIKSGFQPVDASWMDGNIPTYTVMVNDTKPLWFYCGQGAHCQNGMAMVINEKADSGKTLAEYKLAAATVGDGDGGSGGSRDDDASDGSDGGSSGGDTGSGSGDGSGDGSGSDSGDGSGSDSGDGSGIGSGDGSGSGSGDGTDGEDTPGNIPGDADQVGNPSAAATAWAWTTSMLLVVGAAAALI
ncbi:uncharacterized protein J7T54_004830 [Emericellopsis cladophorae]|uniref:Extracellular serine-rich protein n=1 Tax=Emericellopsis cladophorae TaxID=2686198 RepID=A0A9P9Y679_9HYPO|nr:uncharacterized protein J7T54_004830 [Emericellopsis cladophorae]KAI6784284.1 hypothetical protein J7T54_004830 [Emericellopsis cladophorae]